jgi:TupA-like ATPgrasp
VTAPVDRSGWARSFASRVYFSGVVPRRLRDTLLDWRIRRAGAGELAYQDPPQTFMDKVRYKMLHDRRPLLTTFADKVAVRDYVEAKAGKEVLTDLVLVTDDAGRIRENGLPREFALKMSHASGGIVIVGDHVAPEKALPKPSAGWVKVEVSPAGLDWERLSRLCRGWLSRRYRPTREWAYRYVPPRILVEELLLVNGAVPPDLRFFVFNGRVRLVGVDMGRFSLQVGSFYWPDWTPIPVQEPSTPEGPPVERPSALPEMIRIAEALGQETDFVRVDLYQVGDRIVFGELTNYPWGGLDEFRPASFNYELGALWTLSETKL